MSGYKIHTFLLLALFLTSCGDRSPHTQTVIPGMPTAISSPPVVNQTEAPILVSTVVLQETHEEPTSQVQYLPNLWTKIDKAKITFYPQDWLSDFTYAKDGSLWMVGGFGVIHQGPNGQQTWYSIKNGLPVNFFTSVAISPKDEVWVGGTDNALFRWDGTQWIDEGIKIPLPFDTREEWLCYSKEIAGIDFDQNGNAWVMNAGIEIYAQVYGQWVNIPFPKNILPIAGGGGCPLGIRVVSEDDITIKREGCCASPPSGYHFNGVNWTETSDFQVVDNLLNARHRYDRQSIAIDSIERSGYTNWPFDTKQVLPEFFDRDGSITTDDNGTVWLTDGSDLYNNDGGIIHPYQDNYANDYSDIASSQILNFGDKVLFYQEGKRPNNLFRWFSDTSFGWYQIEYITVDSRGRVWFYCPGKGLTVEEKGNIKVLGKIPDPLAVDIGGVLPLNDGRVIVGEKGILWLFDTGHWQRWIIPNTDELFTHLKVDSKGTIYAATDTSVYKIQNNNDTYNTFVIQDKKPVVVSDTGIFDDCTFHRRYTIASNCPGMWNESPTMHYTAKLLYIQDDDSTVYINNRVIAKYENSEWKSFLFDTLNIESAAVDKYGYIWIYTGANGLIRLAPDIFNVYYSLILP